MELSIIMPLYNVEKTLKFAIESILFQEVNFEYEIIAIDDASSDATYSLLYEYKNKYPFIKIFQNENNIGNALSFYKGLSHAKGKYFCVLDGDDFYSVKNKLQKQVNFLNNDKELSFSAVAHKSLRLYSDGTILNDKNIFNKTTEYTYFDFISKKFYFHTSSIMFRNIFRDKNFDFFKIQRGDNFRTFTTLYFTYGKIKCLNFVGSVYCYTKKGIWSSLSQQDQLKINNTFWENCIKISQTQKEKSILAKNISSCLNKNVQISTLTLDECIKFLYKESSKYAFSDKNFIFRRLFKSEFIDSFCETIGRIELIRRKVSFFNKIELDKNSIAIIISSLNSTGGGVYQEIKELIEAYSEKSVFIILTDILNFENLHESVKKDFSKFKNSHFIFFEHEEKRNIKVLFDILLKIKPHKVYQYCGHNNCLASTTIQSGLYKNINIFSFDHGFSLSLENSSIDCFIAKTPKDFYLLKSRYNKKVIYIPCWIKSYDDINYTYKQNRNIITTATASARFYKIENSILGKFTQFITNLLMTTKGIHIHYGPIPKIEKNNLYTSLQQNHIDLSNFIHIEWTESLPSSLIKNNVSLFISPFPISSIRITLQCISAGIPIIVYMGNSRIECNDYVHPESLKWNRPNEFWDIINSLNKINLAYISIKGKEYIKTHNNLELLKTYIISETSFPKIPNNTIFYETHIIDICDVIDFFRTDNIICNSQYIKKNYHNIIFRNKFTIVLSLFMYIIMLFLSILPFTSKLFKSQKIIQKIKRKILQF